LTNRMREVRDRPLTLVEERVEARERVLGGDQDVRLPDRSRDDLSDDELEFAPAQNLAQVADRGQQPKRIRRTAGVFGEEELSSPEKARAHVEDVVNHGHHERRLMD